MNKENLRNDCKDAFKVLIEKGYEPDDVMAGMLACICVLTNIIGGPGFIREVAQRMIEQSESSLNEENETK